MLRSQFFSYVAQTSPEPMGLEVAKAQGSWIWDTQGKRYLDLIAGISVSNVGHCHPKVVAAICKQAETYAHTLVYGEHIQGPQVALAQALVKTLPPSLNSVYFVNSGSEAIEGALKLAKRITGRFQLLGCRKAYHGSSHGALSLNGDEYFKRNFRPLLPGVGQIVYGSFSDLEQITDRTAAVVVETVQGEAGVVQSCPTWFSALSQRCKETGCLLILDEIQTGFGRTGTFWAFEQMVVVPDILVTAKAMGGGLPLGAFVASKEKMASLQHEPVLGHITTFGGNPICCAASLAALTCIFEENLLPAVKEKEDLFKKKLQHTAIQCVRSAGLLMAVELGSFDKVKSVIQYGLAKGLITDWFLHCNTALRIAPPLTITEEEIEFASRIILEALDQTA